MTLADRIEKDMQTTTRVYMGNTEKNEKAHMMYRKGNRCYNREEKKMMDRMSITFNQYEERMKNRHDAIVTRVRLQEKLKQRQANC